MLVLTARRMPSRTTVLKPCELGLDVVDAVEMFGNVKLPVSFVTVSCETLVRVSVTTTVTPGSAAPVWSVTVPSIVPRVAWALAEPGRPANTSATSATARVGGDSCACAFQ